MTRVVSVRVEERGVVVGPLRVLQHASLDGWQSLGLTLQDSSTDAPCQRDAPYEVLVRVVQPLVDPLQELQELRLEAVRRVSVRSQECQRHQDEVVFVEVELELLGVA